MNVNEKIEKLIIYYQAEADRLKEAVDAANERDSVVSTYKWMNSLWRTVCSFIENLDTLGESCDIEEVIENCDDCGFCQRKEKTNGDY